MFFNFRKSHQIRNYTNGWNQLRIRIDAEHWSTTTPSCIPGNKQKVICKVWKRSFSYCPALTSLNDSRKHLILPKHSIETGCCAEIMTVGSIRCTSMGNEYQLNWSSISLMLTCVEQNCSPISQVKNTKPNEANATIKIKTIWNFIWPSALCFAWNENEIWTNWLTNTSYK